MKSIEKLLILIIEKNSEYLLALGDYCAPFTIQNLIEVNLPIAAVFGNNDGDQGGIGPPGVVDSPDVGSAPAFRSSRGSA